MKSGKLTLSPYFLIKSPSVVSSFQEIQTKKSLNDISHDVESSFVSVSHAQMH